MTALVSYIALILACCTMLFFALNKKFNKGVVFKVISLSLALVFALRYIWADDAIRDVYALTSNIFNSKFTNLMATVMVWLTYSCNFLLILYAFFKVKLINKFVYFICLPVSLINLFILPIHIKAIMGANALASISIRAILLAVEIGISLGYSIAIAINTNAIKSIFGKNKNKVGDNQEPIYGKNIFLNIWTFVKKHWIVVFCFAVVIFSTFPAYGMQAFWGSHYELLDCLNFEMPHRIILYIGIVLPFVIHFSLRNESYDERKFYLLFISLATLTSYMLNYKYLDWLDPTDLPLHLCNTAMFIMPLVLIFNMKKFFYFTYFINIAGAAIAMILPNYSVDLNMFSPGLVMFYINHYIAFFMPILFVSLGMFERPKFKHFLYSMYGFAGYFILVLFLNALFTGLYDIGKVSSTTDYFFLNDDFIVTKLGAKFTMNYELVLRFGKLALTFYPLYQAIFFVAYIGIALVMWFIFAQAYEIADGVADMRQRKAQIKIEQLALNLKGDNMKNPVSPENKDKLVLINFSKKYGSSKHFAVKDASFEVNGGEVFGFLGPNGAGKSTIIKSIVGIQPITSGRIEVCGYDVGTQSIESKMNLGFVPDHYALYEKLTGREYINYIADLYKVSKEDRNERIQRMVERFELAHSFDNQMKTYSHGMKQKIAIMAALVHNPKIWILDEPLTGLDPNSIFQVKECMKEHVANGNIVFFSSHIIDVVEKICDRIAIIKKGEIQCVKTLKEIEESGVSLEEFYMKIING